MAFKDLLAASQGYFPNLQLKYKNQSSLMKFIGTLLFFNKGFMTDFLTTIGDTVYAPNDTFFKLHPVSSPVVFLHELVHFYDHNRLGTFRFQLLYALPQILVLPALLLFLVSWKLALPLFLLSLLPWPAYFRMQYEKRAYLASLYCIQQVSLLMNFNANLPSQVAHFVKYFTTSSYYWMWPFQTSLTNEFNTAVQNILNGKRPYEDGVFDMLDVLIKKVP